MLQLPSRICVKYSQQFVSPLPGENWDNNKESRRGRSPRSTAYEVIKPVSIIPAVLGIAFSFIYNV